MPSDELDQTSTQAERLSRKIDRLRIGHPSPVHDGDTEELASIAQLLMEQLGEAQPDPAFREQLKRDLIDPGPRLVPFQPRNSPRRYPVPALFGALTAVLVASAVTGWMVFASTDGNGSDSVQQIAQFASASPTAAFLMAGSAATIDSTSDSARIFATATSQTVPATTAEQPTTTLALSLADQSASAESAPTIQQAVIDMPPVDARHVELGALATVASPTGISGDIRFRRAEDGETVDVSSTGTAYQFSTPYVDPTFILRSVQEFLGIEAQIEPRDRGGKVVYALSSPEGTVNFTWSPDTGAFSCMLPDPYSTEDIQDLSEAAIQWLKEFGFPVGNEIGRPVVQTNENGQTFVHVPLGDPKIPDPAVGHPLSITLVVDKEGRIVSVSGYWLEVTSQSQVPLVTAEQAWKIVESGGGYWPQGSEPTTSGEFVAEHFQVRYMLTSSGEPKKGLILQPVIAISGTFAPDDGSGPTQLTVYVQGMSHL